MDRVASVSQSHSTAQRIILERRKPYCLVLTGRREQGRVLFERLLALSNDVGLLAEEYDHRERCMLGNFPQALTHKVLTNTARLLSVPAHAALRASKKGERAVSEAQES